MCNEGDGLGIKNEWVQILVLILPSCVSKPKAYIISVFNLNLLMSNNKCNYNSQTVLLVVFNKRMDVKRPRTESYT